MWITCVFRAVTSADRETIDGNKIARCSGQFTPAQLVGIGANSASDIGAVKPGGKVSRTSFSVKEIQTRG